MLAAQLCHDRIHLSLCLLESYTFFQTSNSFNVMRSPLRWISCKRERPPEINIFAISQGMIVVARMFCTGRHDTHNGKGLGVQSNLPSHNLRLSIELRMPQPVAQDHLHFVSRKLSLCIELMSQLRLQSKHAEVSRGDSESV